MMRNVYSQLGVTLLAIAIGVPAALAQQQTQDQQQNQGDQQNQGQQQTPGGQQTPAQPTQPVPAYHSPLADIAPNGPVEEQQDVSPDTRPLAGAQTLSLGIPTDNASYWQPRFDALATGDSDALSLTNQKGWATYVSLLGGLDLHKVYGPTDLTLSYTGGGSFSDNSSVGNSVIQHVGFDEKLSWRRTDVSFIDQLDYLPETSFGYTPGGITGGTAGLQSGLTAGQSILTARGQRVTNTFVTQVDTYLTPRSSITILGGYSALRYFSENLLDSADIMGQVGYNYQATRKDTIALLYRFTQYWFNQFSPKIDDHVAQFSYARRLTGRLAFQAAVGPEITEFPETPVGGGLTNSGTHINWSANSELSYRAGRSGVGFAYNHGVTGGSGVFAGARTDMLSGSLSHQFSRRLNTGFSAGFARNATLSVGSVAAPNQTFDYWFGGVNVSENLSRTVSLTLSYQAEYQNSNATFCIGPTCQTNFTRNLISLGVGWHDRPIPF